MHDNVFLELKTIVHYPNRSGVRAQNMHSTYLANKEKTYLDCHKASRTGSHTSRRTSRLLTRPWFPRVTAVQSLSSCSVGGQAARQLSALCPTLGREAVRRSLWTSASKERDGLLRVDTATSIIGDDRLLTVLVVDRAASARANRWPICASGNDDW